MIVGVDLFKDHKIIEKAYNDSEGITELFNKNILDGVNKIYGLNFDNKFFEHKAFFNKNKKRIEMHLVSTKDQYVKIMNKEILFKCGETIHTENSYKYTVNEFNNIVNKAGYKTIEVLKDKQSFFGLFILKVKG